MHSCMIGRWFATMVSLPLVVVLMSGADQQEQPTSILRCPSEIPDSLKEFDTFITESDHLLAALRGRRLDAIQDVIGKSAVFRNDNYSLSLQYHVGELTNVALTPATSERDWAFSIYLSSSGYPKVISQKNLFWKGEHVVVFADGRAVGFHTAEREVQDGVPRLYRKGLQITWDESGKLVAESVLESREPLFEFRMHR